MKGLERRIDQYSQLNDSDNSEIPKFTDNKVVPTYGLEQQILVLRGFNKTYRERINQLSMDNATLEARVEVLCSLLCDAGIPLPPDLD
jgi:hypothetical protein